MRSARSSMWCWRLGSDVGPDRIGHFVDGLRFLLAEEVAAGSRPIGGLLDQFLSVNTIARLHAQARNKDVSIATALGRELGVPR
jgi:hypothetical protein